MFTSPLIRSVLPQAQDGASAQRFRSAQKQLMLPLCSQRLCLLVRRFVLANI